jgi:murein DD-endopeptidase MepM/ murein hydrolase activator NlpD
VITTKLGRLIVTILASAGVFGGLLVTALTPAEAAGHAGAVDTGGHQLNVRSGPSAGSARVRTLPHRARITIQCQQPGQKIWGRVRTTNLWDRLADGTYVSDAYISRGPSTPPRCADPDGRAATQRKRVVKPRWVAPVTGVVGSGFRTVDRPLHDGVDLPAPKNTPVRAAARGTVTLAVCSKKTGDCDVDGSLAVPGCGWYVEIAHADGLSTRYCHLIRRPLVTAGQRVFAGQVIGYVGTSGNSSGPHLHFEVHTGTPPTHANAVEPVAFMRTKGIDIGRPE